MSNPITKNPYVANPKLFAEMCLRIIAFIQSGSHVSDTGSKMSFSEIFRRNTNHGASVTRDSIEDTFMDTIKASNGTLCLFTGKVSPAIKPWKDTYNQFILVFMSIHESEIKDHIAISPLVSSTFLKRCNLVCIEIITKFLAEHDLCSTYYVELFMEVTDFLSIDRGTYDYMKSEMDE